MIPCVVVLLVSVLGLIVCIRKKHIEMKKALLVCIAASVIAMLAGYMESKNVVLNEAGYLLRQESGSGSYEAEILLEVEGMEAQTFIVNVPEQTFSEAEETAYLEAAIEEIEEEFKGENSSLEEIRHRVVIRNNYQEGLVTAEWNFSNSKLFEEDGDIIESALAEDGEEVCALVTLQCGESSFMQTFYFKVFREEKSEEEELYEKINAIISENSKAEGTEILALPKEVEGRTLSWKNKESAISVQILFLGLLVAFLIPEIEKEREKEQKKKREARLLQSYLEMVNKLTLLLGAGMTVQGAWGRITDMYLMARKEKQIPQNALYEEMLITRHEIENGRGEMRSYEAFGERCGLPQFRKFSNYLVQNLKKGSNRICDILEKEEMEVFAERKNVVRRYGEEATTKLLFPMLLMLGIVIFIIMVPAIISFQTGT